MKDMRVGVMFYYRTNRDQIGLRNLAVPTSAYTAFTVTVPNGPGGTVANPKPMTATVYNLQAAFNGLQNNVIDNQPYLDTVYKGLEFTASKRFSNRWQMVAGLTIGKNTGGLNTNTTGASGQSATNDLNDPNFTTFSNGIVGNDSDLAFRLSGSYRLPYRPQPRGDAGLEPWLSVHLELLGDPRRGDRGWRGVDPVDARR